MRDLLIWLAGLKCGKVKLLETFKSFDLEKNDSVLAVILIAIIAVARRIVLFDLNGASDEIVLASLGVIMISLAAAYYLVKKTKCKAD
ncbi:MAG: hypothetical protein A4E44_00740 [Methanosaeta sp. PtaB.Bin018]|nr:MAG: hypothetical protein A4E44_00740 [Methanosaeta sp. PtaB.Bin018]